MSGVPWRSSCPSADSVATEWISSAYGRICLTLRDCSWPMKCQRKPGWAVALASSSCARFSPTSVDPGLAQHVELLERDVLDRGEDLHVAGIAARVGDRRAHALEVRRDPARVEPGDQARHTTPDWRPVTPSSRRCENSAPRGEQIVQMPVSWTSMPCASSCARATTAMSRLRPRRAS